MTAKTSVKTRAREGGSTDEEVRELLVLLSGIFVALKKQSGERPKHEALQDAFEKSDLGDRHIAPLLALVISGPASVSELAERIGLTLGTTSLLVGELSRAGLVDRREDEEDRRRTIVSVKDSIEAVIHPSLSETLRPLARSLDRMSASQRAHFMDGLRILNEEVRRSRSNGLSKSGQED